MVNMNWSKSYKRDCKKDKEPAGPGPVIAEPANLNASLAGSSVNLKWVGVATAEFYEIFRNGVSVGISSSASYFDMGLDPDTTYIYYVKAIDAAGNVSGQSNTASITTGPAPVEEPAAVVIE